MAHRYDTISFLSDYGTADEFVGVVKSVIRDIAPHTTVIDLTHGIAPFDVRAGSLALARSISYVASGVIVAVVDPGVGTSRRGIAVEVADTGDEGADLLTGREAGEHGAFVGSDVVDARVVGETAPLAVEQPDASGTLAAADRFVRFGADQVRDAVAVEVAARERPRRGGRHSVPPGHRRLARIELGSAACAPGQDEGTAVLVGDQHVRQRVAVDIAECAYDERRARDDETSLGRQPIAREVERVRFVRALRQRRARGQADRHAGRR